MARDSSLAAVETFDKNALKKSETQERGYEFFLANMKITCLNDYQQRKLYRPY